ncbi:unnamed protein product [Trifolium pratense]|uniref:Uncharacterized protein n=1 Tax=Trifolium pratense TaxID=57577 RepID=A0ACB0J9A9_TRIPR|nr:unnamed protein product [Trifolium pratense]
MLICSDLKGIMSALHLIRDKEQKDEHKNEETISRFKLIAMKNVDCRYTNLMAAAPIPCKGIVDCPPSWVRKYKCINNRCVF